MTVRALRHPHTRTVSSSHQPLRGWATERQSFQLKSTQKPDEPNIPFPCPRQIWGKGKECGLRSRNKAVPSGGSVTWHATKERLA